MFNDRRLQTQEIALSADWMQLFATDTEWMWSQLVKTSPLISGIKLSLSQLAVPSLSLLAVLHDTSFHF